MPPTVTRPLVRPWMRPVYFVLGFAFLAIGIVGVVLPLIPTTGPLLLAAFFFARSSARFHDRLMGHPRFGPLIADFQAGRGIPLLAKVWALAAMTVAFGSSVVYLGAHWSVRLAVALIGALAIGYVARLPVSKR